MSEHLRVIELKTSNFMGIKAAQITPEGDTVVIGGRNGQGKTSILNAIECAIRGKRHHPDRPIRDGAESGEVSLDLGALKIRRKFTESGGSISVENGEGMCARKPQELLDELAGAISFDPLAFGRLEPAAQLAMVRELAGVDVAELDAEAERVRSERREINRTTKILEGQLAGMPWHPDAPEAGVDVGQILTEMRSAREANTDSDDARSDLGRARDHLDGRISERRAMADEVAAAAERLKEMRAALKQHDEKLKADEGTFEAEAQRVAALGYIDLGPMEAKLEQAEGINSTVSANAAYVERQRELEETRGQAYEKTERILELASERAKRISEADLPVPGLSFSDADGVTLSTIPFSQCSAAERLRASVAMGIALHPRLRVMLIRDGSLLDDESMETLAKIAAEHDMQIWIERVGTHDQGAIVIDCGEVVGANEG